MVQLVNNRAMGIKRIIKRISENNRTKRVKEAEWMSRQFCYIQDDRDGKLYVWLHGIPAFAVEDKADQSNDVLTLQQAKDFVARMRKKYVEEHCNDTGRQRAACY